MLFKDANKLKEFAQVSGTITFDEVRATISLVEEQHIVPFIGRALYSSIDTAYNAQPNESALSNNQKDLIAKCRQVIGSYFTYYYALKSDVSLTDGGIRRMETQTHKTAYQYQVKQFLESMLRQAEIYTEQLISFLEQKKSDYSEWTASDEFKAYRSLFIKTGAEFNDNFPTHSPYRNYMAMRGKMVDVEELIIRPFLGDSLYNSLKEKNKEVTPSFTDKEKVLLVRLKKAIANFTISQSIPYLNVRIAENGLSVISQTPRSSSDEMASRSNADSASVSLVMESAERSARSWMDSAAVYLRDNKSEFSTWPGNISANENSGACVKTNSFGLI